MFDSYVDMGLHVAVALAASRGDLDLERLRGVLADDPPSAQAVSAADVIAFEALSEQLVCVLGAMADRDVDTAAGLLNDLLETAPTRPHLSKDDGRWRLHHHPHTSEPAPMWQAICAEAVARALSAGYVERIGRCADPLCRTLYLDASRNGTRQYCSARCQNRAKVRAFRSRAAAEVSPDA